MSQDKQDHMTQEETVLDAAVEAEAMVDEVLSQEDLLIQVAELKGQLEDEKLRALANEQNLRRRHQEEIQSAHKFATQKFATDLLAVKDYLEMALMDESGQFDALKMGVSMTLNELEKAFERGQVSEVEAKVGDKLDPHAHQALQMVESDLEANHIVNVMKKGYQLADRVIRPAMVTVSKG